MTDEKFQQLWQELYEREAEQLRIVEVTPHGMWSAIPQIHEDEEPPMELLGETDGQ